MNAAINRLMLEAATAAANYSSQPHREVGAREVRSIGIGDLVDADDGTNHLRMAIRDAALAIALLRDAPAIAEVATAIQAMVRAASSEARLRCATAPPRRWWIDGDAA
jgi:hypothetical protein